MPDLSPWYAARDLMRRALEDDLMGSAADEVLTEAPLDRFVVGILHPSSNAPVEDAGEVPDMETGTQPDAEPDPGVSLARMRYPSSMGLTFAVDPSSTPFVELSVSADRYLPSPSPTADADHEAGTSSDAHTDLGDAAARPPEPMHRRGRERPTAWDRAPLSADAVRIDVRLPATFTVELTAGLAMRVVVRRPVGTAVSVTAALVNAFPRPQKGPSDEWCWFRPRIIASAESGEFTDRRPGAGSGSGNQDDRSGHLLHRSVRSLAVGHGCSVTWPQEAHVTEVSTTFFPHHDVLVSRAERADVPDLGMATLAQTDSRTTLRALVERYQQWIAGQERRIPDLEPAHRPVARGHVETARRAAERMLAGIETLERDAAAAGAFRVMNAVMQEQRARQDMIRAGAASPSGDEQLWRPFQMAFILLNLKGLVEDQTPERDIADLLWFPTGGGKTEAYLGLIAFTIALRRLRGGTGRGGGVAVLMRYTLRLLTVQQFERAAGLICALEVWRSHELPEAAPVSIGLWVGQAATPNNVKDAASALNRADVDGRDSDTGNPRQLLHCPWCGADLGTDCYDADRRKDRLTVRCSDVLCEFRSGLPVHVVDSDVYRERPSLVIGTVDKFALLAWNERAGRLFGTDGTVDPPDLIVQDELHLISGPLGTLVGLYETAVDAAATGRARPKLVASTATIRRAPDQVRAVFAREAEQFPPPGIDADDSFFAVDAPADEAAARQYLGIMAPSTSHATLLVRTYAALLQRASTIDVDDTVRDAYWTLLGYFNSLRVLGAAFMQSVDDVPDQIRVGAERSGQARRGIAPPRELTSRTKSSEIPLELAALATTYPGAPDIVLATNMISVGVDVDRLGLMVVMGQPQTTSEYIQATSRVGRQVPGLIVTLYNAARSRDLSHYESFIPYHRALYAQVEATGATPFAARARDRGLHGVLVALARLLIPNAATEKAVSVPLRRAEDVARIRRILIERAARVAPSESDDVAATVDVLIGAWLDGLDAGMDHYSGWDGGKHALLVPAGGGPGMRVNPSEIRFPVDAPAWSTLTSLRNVDAESTLYLARGRSRRRNHGTE